MKKICLFFVQLLAIGQIWAQTPNLFNYQGVAKGANGVTLSNKDIKLRLSVRESSTNGQISYSETRTVKTSANGLFAVQIGAPGALTTTGTIAGVNWTSTTKFLQVEMDPTNGTSFLNLGTTPLGSVPYSKYADASATLMPDAQISLGQINAGSAVAGQTLLYNGSTLAPANLANPPASNLVLPYMGTVQINNPEIPVSISNIGTGRVLNLNSSNGTGLLVGSKGTAINAQSSSTSKAALQATNTGLGGTALSLANTGTGSVLKVQSAPNATALDVSGNVRIYGGTTNPVASGRLVSDEFGNAKWKPTRVGFKASELNAPLTITTTDIAQTNDIRKGEVKIKFKNKKFDLGNNYQHDSGSFRAPVTGEYNFSAKALVSAIDKGIVYDSPKLLYASFNIRVYRNSGPSDDFIASKSFESTKLMYMNLMDESVITLNKGEKVEFFETVSTTDVNAILHDASVSATLSRAW